MPHEKSGIRKIVALVVRAVWRARIPVLTVGVTYLISVSAGITMVLGGNEWAMAYRDNIVSKAQSSPTILALRRDDRLRAAVLDFGGNLFGAFCDTLGGLGVVVPYPIMAYRGWIGGIVSIDGSHQSRLADPREAAYYLITLTLQLIPYMLSGGAGVNMGLAFLKPNSFYQGEKWLGIPREALMDVFRIYILVIPLFLAASLWEFFQR